jgi:hypothetical protein
MIIVEKGDDRWADLSAFQKCVEAAAEHLMR